MRFPEFQASDQASIADPERTRIKKPRQRRGSKEL